MYTEPAANQAVSLAKTKCSYCAACYICLASPTPDIEIAAITGVWNIGGDDTPD